jgi:hypothetical protein
VHLFCPLGLPPVFAFFTPYLGCRSPCLTFLRGVERATTARAPERTPSSTSSKRSFRSALSPAPLHSVFVCLSAVRPHRRECSREGQKVRKFRSLQHPASRNPPLEDPRKGRLATGAGSAPCGAPSRDTVFLQKRTKSQLCLLRIAPFSFPPCNLLVSSQRPASKVRTDR